MGMYKQNRVERAFDVFNHILLVCLTLAFIIPFLVVVGTSFTGAAEAARRGAYVLIPENFDFSAYRALLGKGSPVYGAYGNTLFRVLVGTFLNLAFTVTLAYGMTKKNLPGMGTVTTLVFITMLFNGGLIPTYMVVKHTGLTNSVWSMIVPGLIGTWNLLMMRQFFSQIPDSLEESATIDGATPAGILFRIVLPLSLPSIATVGLFYAVSHWNAWFDASIYINDVRKLPVQIIMKNMIVSMAASDLAFELVADNPPPAEGLKSAVIVVSTLPILFIYPFVQKYFVKGVMIGAVKG